MNDDTSEHKSPRGNGIPSVASSRRKTTDQSLNAERAKTDRAMTEERQKAQARVDRARTSSRNTADASKLAARFDVDSQEKVTAGDRQSDEVRNASKKMLEDRIESDKNLRKERHEMDVLLEFERSQERDIQSRLFQLERNKTDKALEEERTHIDADAQRNALVLSDARAANGALVDALATRDDFLAIVSHDLRNPLSSIIMTIDLMKSTSEYSQLSERMRSSICVISRNAEVSLRLISDLLDLERIGTGNLKLQVDKVNVNELLDKSSQMFKDSAAIKGVALDVQPCEQGCFVHCDLHRILQVLSNLIGNAIKFTPRGGTISVTARACAQWLQVEVADTGPGIAEGQQEMIFERNSQIGGRDRTGLGLGLYISSMIVKEHRGKLWVESEVGRGSRFCFTVPI